MKKALIIGAIIVLLLYLLSKFMNKPEQKQASIKKGQGVNIDRGQAEESEESILAAEHQATLQARSQMSGTATGGGSGVPNPYAPTKPNPHPEDVNYVWHSGRKQWIESMKPYPAATWSSVSNTWS